LTPVIVFTSEHPRSSFYIPVKDQILPDDVAKYWIEPSIIPVAIPIAFEVEVEEKPAATSSPLGQSSSIASASGRRFLRKTSQFDPSHHKRVAKSPGVVIRGKSPQRKQHEVLKGHKYASRGYLPTATAIESEAEPTQQDIIQGTDINDRGLREWAHAICFTFRATLDFAKLLSKSGRMPYECKYDRCGYGKRAVDHAFYEPKGNRVRAKKGGTEKPHEPGSWGFSVPFFSYVSEGTGQHRL
jgi:hypothetical protein